MRVLAWNAGGAVLDPDKPSIKGDSKSVLNKDQYKNLKAQAWYRLRTRFSKTFRAVRHGESFEPDELVSIDSTIPLLHQLKMELSQPVRKQNDVGKFTVDKKPDGTASPNLADAFVQCYNPVRKISSFDAV
jgi:phage terminase large subunit